MQRLQRHGVAIIVVASALLAPAPDCAQAQQHFPTKPIRLVASTTAGSQPDTIARMIGQKITESWGQAIVIDNRPGGGGTLAAAPVAKATPDGHTLLYVLPNFVTAAVLQQRLPYDPLKDFVGISQIGISTNVLAAAPTLGVKSVGDLVALAKAQPGKLIFVSGPTGTAVHLTGARFNFLTGIKAVHVAFKGGPEATIEVLAGRAHYHVGTMGVTLPFIREGKLLALGVTTPQRSPVLPDVPALGELLPEFKRPETSHGLLAPAGTPRPIVAKISREVARILELPDVKERLQNISFVAAPSTSEEYDKILRGQIESVSGLARDIGLRPK